MADCFKCFKSKIIPGGEEEGSDTDAMMEGKQQPQTSAVTQQPQADPKVQGEYPLLQEAKPPRPRPVSLGIFPPKPPPPEALSPWANDMAKVCVKSGQEEAVAKEDRAGAKSSKEDSILEEKEVMANIHDRPTALAEDEGKSLAKFEDEEKSLAKFRWSCVEARESDTELHLVARSNTAMLRRPKRKGHHLEITSMPPEDVRSLALDTTPSGLYFEETTSGWSLHSDFLQTPGEGPNLTSRKEFQSGYSMVALPGSLERMESGSEYTDDL